MTAAAAPVPIQRSQLERPRLAGPYIQRPTLEPQLDRMVTTPLTIVVAPAGHGKTRTLAEWATRRTLATVWLTVGRRDGDLTRFAAHLAAALDRAFAGLAPPLYARLVAPDRLAPSELGEAFGDALFDLDQDLALVLDDFHLADTTAVAAFVAGLILAAPARLHTILSARRPPALPLARLRSVGQIAELTAADLRFSARDTAAFLRETAGNELAPELAVRAHAAVGGWPAAVRLLALGVGAGATLGDGHQLLAAPSEQLVLDYLSEEVLAHLTARQRDLLLRASLPERFSPRLLEALAATAGSASISQLELETLSGLDLYRAIPGSDEPWFAYHPLFRRTFQRQLLSDLGPSGIAHLHHACASWLAHEGLIEPAVWHLVQAGDIAAAGALIETRLAAAFGREDWRAIAAWLQLIPEPVIAQRPELLLASAWVAYLSGRGGALASRFAQLRAHEAQGALSGAQRAQLDLLTLDMTSPSAADRPPVSVVEGVLPHLPRSDRYRVGFAQLMLGLALASDGRILEALDRLAAFTTQESAQIDAASIRGFFGRLLVLWQAGHVAACEQVAADQLQLARLNNLPVSAGWATLFLGLVAHEQGDLDTAAGHFAAVIADAEQLHFACVREAFCRQILIFERQGRLAEADRALARLREHILAIAAPEHLAICDSLAARLALFRGDRPAATQWLATAPPDQARVEWLHLEIPRLTRAMVLIALGPTERWREAAGLLEELRRQAEVAHAALALIDINALAAVLHDVEGRPHDAVAALRVSLAFGAEARLATRYTFLPLPLAPIFRRLVHAAAPPAHAAAALAALEAALAARQPPDRSEANLEPAEGLTKREVEVVRCLNQRMTSNEIGEALFMSPNTARNHVAHIYAKLGVSTRHAAVARASELGLLA